MTRPSTGTSTGMRLLSGSRILPSLRPAVRGVVADQAADPRPRVSGQRHHSRSRRLSDPGLSRLPGPPMPDLPGRGGVGLLRDQEGAFLRPARPSGHHSGGHGGGLHGDRANVDERDVVPNLYDKILLIGDKGFISGELEGRRRRPTTSTSRRRCARTCRTTVIPVQSPVCEDQAHRGNRHRQTLGDVRRPDNQGAGPSKLREPNGQKAPGLQLLSHVCSIVTAQKPENWVLWCIRSGSNSPDKSHQCIRTSIIERQNRLPVEAVRRS